MGVKENLKKLKSILHLIMLGLEVTFYCLVWNYLCVKCGENLVFQQFVDATYGAFVTIMFVACIGICVGEEFRRRTLMVITFCGGGFHAVSAILIGLELSGKGDHFRVVITIVINILLTGLYLIEAIYLAVKKELPQSLT